MKRLLREPLLHFLLLGAALFLLLRAPAEPPGSRRIVVTPRDVEHLTATFTRAWKRAPTPAEVDALIQEFVREEVFYREGLDLGLDADDPVIRQRMRQKMEALAEDEVLRAAATDLELQAYYDANPEAFRQEPRVALRQVFLDADKRGSRLQADAAVLLQTLQASQSVDPTTLGDVSLFAYEYADLSVRDVARVFGETFAKQVADAPLGRWSGPFKSHRGVHLVLVSERRDGEMPAFADVRDAVAREVARTQRAAAVEALYRRLRQRYEIDLQLENLEPPTTTGDGS